MDRKSSTTWHSGSNGMSVHHVDIRIRFVTISDHICGMCLVSTWCLTYFAGFYVTGCGSQMDSFSLCQLFLCLSHRVGCDPHVPSSTCSPVQISYSYIHMYRHEYTSRYNNNISTFMRIFDLLPLPFLAHPATNRDSWDDRLVWCCVLSRWVRSRRMLLPMAV